MRRRNYALLFVCTLILLALVVGLNRYTSPAEEQEPDPGVPAIEAYEAFLAQHPYTLRAPMSRAELKAIPKADRPDLAMEQDFLRTMDPKTGTVPRERLWVANALAADLKQIARRNQPTSVWTERGPNNVGGRTRALMFDPNTANKVWAGSVSGGLWFDNNITTDGGWTNVSDVWANMSVSAIAYDPTNTQTFYVGTGEGFFNIDAVRGNGLFKSTDGGSNWTQLSSTANSTFNYVQDVAVASNGAVLACTRDGGVQRSTDGGTSWATVLDASSPGASTSRCSDLEVAADGTLYTAMGVFTNGSIHQSTDNGATWSHLSTYPAIARRIALGAAPSDANVLYAVSQKQSAQSVEAIHRSDDAGATWTQLTLPNDCDNFTISDADFTRNQAWYNLVIAVNPTDAADVVVGGIDLFRSKDSGSTWNQVAVWDPFFLNNGCVATMPVVHADQHAIVFDASGQMVIGNDGGVFYAPLLPPAGFPAFSSRNSGFNVTQYYSGALHPNAGNNVSLGGLQDNGTQRLSSSGTGAGAQVVGGDGGFTHIDQTNPNIALTATTRNSLRRSTNGGTSFDNFHSDAATGKFINPSDYDNRENILYSSATTATVFDQIKRFTDMEGTPTGGTVSLDTNVGAHISHLRVSEYAPAGTSNLFLGTDGGRLFKATGAHAGDPIALTELVNPGVTGSVSSIDIGANENQLLVTYSNYGVASVWETTDGGANWTDLDTGSNLPDMPVRWGMYDPNNRHRVLLATEAGVWQSENILQLGKTQMVPAWQPAPSYPTVRVDMLQYRVSDGVILAAAHGRGVFTSFFTTETPLPVELAHFEAETDAGGVTLTWATATETDNAGFEVQHAEESAQAWHALDFVEGAGTTQEGRHYSYRPADLEPGLHRFRLKQVDFDGNFAYSEEIETYLDVPVHLYLSAVYPNPFSHEAVIELTPAKQGPVTVALYDVQGRRIDTLYDGTMAGGRKQTLRVDGRALPNGTYFIQVQGETFAESRKLMRHR